MVMAFRARRTDHPMNGLKAGQCFLGDIKKIGLTERQYRTAKKQLETWNLATFKGTSKGTIGTLLNTKVYDINEESSDEQVTDKRRTVDEQVTTNKECNNGKNEINKDLATSQKQPCWDYEKVKTIWNEEKSNSECPATGCNIVPDSLKSGLLKVHKKYIAYCKSSDKTELERHEWFRAYAKGHLRRCSAFVGKSDNHSWKPSIKDLGQVKTFEALINQ